MQNVDIIVMPCTVEIYTTLRSLITILCNKQHKKPQVSQILEGHTITCARKLNVCFDDCWQNNVILFT